VAGQASSVVLEIIGFSIVNNFESMARCWLCNKKYGIVNVISSAVRWGIWKLRNSMCFQEVAWKNMKQL
jgi:hypothetical protein